MTGKPSPMYRVPEIPSEENHYYKTPPHCTEALLKRESFHDTIWEPCCGDGAIAKVLEAHGYAVIASDLIERGYGTSGIDFLESTELLAPSIVINPPFKLSNEFVIHALELGVTKLAVFQRLPWLEGAKRYDTIFSKAPISKIWVFCKRQTLWRGDDPEPKATGGMIPFGWFIFDKNHRSGEPTLNWIRE